MKRLSVSGPGQFEVLDADIPRPGPGELLVAPLRVGVCATDLELVDGTLVYARTGELKLPVTPGHEWAGRVADVGPHVMSFSVGDLVVGECSIGCGHCDFCSADAYHRCPRRHETGILGLDGAFQQRMAFPASSAHKVPGNVSVEDAALIEPTAVAFRAITRLAPAAGASVLVVGGGVQGSLAAMLLMNTLEADVAVVELKADRFDRLRSLGARAPRVGERFSYVLEAAGSPDSLDVALKRTSPGGTLVVVGLSGRAKVGIAADSLVVNEQALIGSLGSPGVWPDVIGLVASGVIRPSVLVTHVFDGLDFAHACELLRHPHASAGKVLIAPNGL